MQCINTYIKNQNIHSNQLRIQRPYKMMCVGEKEKDQIQTHITLIHLQSHRFDDSLTNTNIIQKNIRKIRRRLIKKLLLLLLSLFFFLGCI